MRKVFRFSRIKVSPIPLNSIKVIVFRRFSIELNGGRGRIIEVAIYILNIGEVALAERRAILGENNGSILDI